MLKKIEIKNINAIKEASFDFSKCKYQYKTNMIYNENLVNPIAFYGTNGSGKSSFLEAIAQLVSLLIDEPSDLQSFIPHLTNTIKDGQLLYKTNGLSSIKLHFTIQNKNYVYYLATTSNSCIAKETLIEDNKELFERTKKEYVYNNEVNEVSSQLFPTLRTLALETNDSTIHLCYDYLSNIAFIDASKNGYKFKIGKQKSYLDIIVEKSKEIKNILSKYKEFPLYDVNSVTDNIGKKSYLVTINHNSGDLTLPWNFISTGMKNQSVLLSVVLSIPENGVLIVDELEDALHPLTIMDFINVVKQKNIQLIFSSHNTYILQALRPDQIFFANWENGFSTYKRLSEIYPNIREVNNIEKMYLSNLFDEDIKK